MAPRPPFPGRPRPALALLLALAPLVLALPAAAQPGRDRALSPPASGDPLEIAVDYLRARRGPLALAAGDLDEVALRDRYRTRRTGVTHLYLRQQLGGIDVFGAVASVAVDEEGRIVSLGDRLLRGLRARPAAATRVLSPADAVRRAAAHLGLEPDAPLRVLRRGSGPDRRVVLAAAGISRDEIPVRLEYVADGARLRLAWNAVIRTPDGRHWWNLHVDAASGEVLRRDDWVDRDTYRVLAEPLMSPDEGPRLLRVDPADPVASPFGWHDTNGVAGSEFSDTRGNNASAQEDADGDDEAGTDVVHRPDGGPGLDFDFPFDTAQQPSGYRDAALANLFYWSNRLHDVLYHYGFDEPAGNFQQNNYGHGGAAGDPVQADAQDGSAVNNAQFLTPPDGQDPRMEMFRWEQTPTPRLNVHSPPAVAGLYLAGKALFGAGTNGLFQTVVLANDGVAPGSDACQPLVNGAQVEGRIVMIDRGTCTFVDKVDRAQDAGAAGAIVVNNTTTPPELVTMSGVDPGITIPAIFLTKGHGDAIRAQLGAGVTATLVSVADRDASMDNGVVVHEYAHGLTNRLTGGPSNVSCLDAPESAGMGEGWSDWLALALTAEPGDEPEDARHVAPYLEGQPPSGPGIRNFPYSTDLGVSPLTYGDVSSLNQPHGVGEVWAASLWELFWSLVGVYGFDPDWVGGDGGNQRALQLVVDALKMQPCDPTFVEGREALLDADAAAYGGAHECLISGAFAKRGVGHSADDGGSPNNLNVTEAFDLLPGCSPACGDALLHFGEQCDDGGTAPFDGCSAACEHETLLGIFGVAQGGEVAVVIEGVSVVVPTSAGQHAAEVAAALAAAIEADPTLSALGVSAVALGGQVAVSGGDVEAFAIDDPGLGDVPQVPALPPWGLGAAALALALAARRLLREAGARRR